MPNADYASFWEKDSFAVVGHEAKKNFPHLTYQGLKKKGKTVFPIDPSAKTIDGEMAYADFESLPGKVDAVVLEVPPEDTRDWISKAADAGVKDVWIHMARETPEAMALAQERGVNARSGTCAVMYLTSGPSVHSLHRWIMKLAGKF